MFVVSDLFFLVLPPFPFFAHFLGFICLSDSFLSTLEFVSVLSNIFVVIFVHVLKATVLGAVALVLFKDFVHDVLSVFLVLPSIWAGVAPILLRWVLVVGVEVLVVIILAVAIVVVSRVAIPRCRLIVLLVVALAGGMSLAIRPGLVVLFFELALAQHLVGLVDLLELFFVSRGGVRVVLFC